MPEVANPVHSLALGDLAFVEDGLSVIYADDASGETYCFDVLAPDTQWGNPQPVTTTLLTLLSNGSQVTHVRDDNREPAIALTIRASGADALAAAEVALVKACGRPVELRWKPPSWASAVTVFEVVWSQLTHQMDDFDELSLRRTYKIELQALPYGRSATKVVTSAVSATSPTVLYNGSSTTSWTALYPAGATLSVASGALHCTYDPSISDWNVYWCTAIARRTATIDTSVNKFIAVDWKASRVVSYWLGTPPQSGGNYPGGEPVHLPEVRRELAPAVGYTRSWYKVADTVTSLPWIQFAVFHFVDSTPGTATFDIDQILTANALPAQGTMRQQTATIVPGGSVPAEGTIKVEHLTDGLGQAIVFTHPLKDGYSPPLRQWIHSSATPTPYADSFSGYYHSLSTPTLYLIPTATIPDGEVHLWVRVAKGLSAGAGAIAWSVQAALSDGSDIGSAQAGATTYNFPAMDAWAMVPLARLSFPVNRSPRVGITLQSTGASLSIDEAWLFAMDQGRLTVLDLGTGPGGLNRVQISAPSLQDPFGSMVVANGPDFNEAFTPSTSQVLCDQTGHKFDPDGSMIFTATEVTAPSISLEHYKRWHTHAAD